MQQTSLYMAPKGHNLKACLLLLTMLAVTAAAQLANVTKASAQEFPVPADANQYILDQTNAYRAQKGLPALSVTPRPNIAADHYAHYLATHTGWDNNPHGADGKDPAGRVTAAGGKFCKIWENVHTSWTKPNKDDTITAMENAMTFWKTSPGHEANLRSASDHMGIGVAGWKAGDEWHYVEVQDFVDTSCLPK